MVEWARYSTLFYDYKFKIPFKSENSSEILESLEGALEIKSVSFQAVFAVIRTFSDVLNWQ